MKHRLVVRRCSGVLAAASMMFWNIANATVDGNLLTASMSTTPWQQCGDDALGIDVSNLEGSTCAYRQTDATAGITYRLTCGVRVVKYASITLTFLDAEDGQLASETTEIDHQPSGAYSVTLNAPAATTSAAVGIYGESGTGFQDCTLLDISPPPGPTEGSVSGCVWFDANSDSILGADESRVTAAPVFMYVDGELASEQQTDAEGCYYFGNLDLDQCVVLGFPPADPTLQPGSFGQDNDMYDTGRTGEHCPNSDNPDIGNIDAGFVPVPPVEPPPVYTLCGLAWQDQNENDKLDGDLRTERGLSDITVTMTHVDSGDTAQVRSDEHGFYRFTDILAGQYRIGFTAPDGYHFVATGPAFDAHYSQVDSDGYTRLITFPDDNNGADGDACNINYVNAGLRADAIVIPPSYAENDSITGTVGDSLELNVLANDRPCDGAASEVTLLGHSVPGDVTMGSPSGRLTISNTKAHGTYSIEYGLRGACGSFATAQVRVELEPAVVIDPSAPEAPVCRVETGGSFEIGGVDVWNTSNTFATEYRLYDANRVRVFTGFSGDVSHRVFLTSRNLWEIEWTGSHFGFPWLHVYYVSAVENGAESSLTLCQRDRVSPIALDLDFNGELERLPMSVSVDLDNDGTRENLLEWFGPGDGILVQGTVGALDGKSASGEMLFGNIPGQFADGFAKLAPRDSNSDGVLSGAELKHLMVWRDLDSNTIIEASELAPLQAYGIESLNLNHYKYMARATLANGRQMLIEDVWLALQPIELASGQ